jgi:hypothetical protein
MANNNTNIQQSPPSLESGTYEIIRNRLNAQANELRSRMQQLNEARKAVFGAIETQLIATDRINTANYCIARDIVAIGQYCIFGYNVHVGLRSGIELKDVFSIYQFKDQRFEEADLSMLQDEKFQQDFSNLYRYYKDAYFARFSQRGAYLYMVFHLTEKGEDFKTFKWLVTDEGIEYIDNRSDHEVRFPAQHEFKWKRLGRDDHRKGPYPHVSVMDRVFVETVGGDLTIKVEDNTEDGRGIYREEVDHSDQTLDDAEYLYADLGNLIAFKIRPYQEEYRYFIFNEKMQEVQRIDSLEDSGVLLPDEHGLIFANGYYLKTGEYKIFDPDMRNKLFKKRIVSPNGEDYLYVFYDKRKGIYVLLHYNVIQQEVATPILCSGFTLFPEGELCYFRSEEDPTKHHVMQIWQTPFVAGEQVPSEHTDSYLYKIGNKDIVRAMAECTEILVLCGKEDDYANLYDDLVKRSTDVIDSYYWLNEASTFQLKEPLAKIRETANSAIDAYEKKVRTQKETQAAISKVQINSQNLFDQIRRQSFDSVDQFVSALSQLRQVRGEIIGLKDLPYTDEEIIAHLEEETDENTQRLSEGCVSFLLQDEALAPYNEKIAQREGEISDLNTAKQANELEEASNQIGSELELLIEIVSNLKIEDATQSTRIIDNISVLFTRLNQLKAAIKRKKDKLAKTEAIAEFSAQMRLLDQSIINYLEVSDSPQKCDEYLSKLMVQLEELESRFVEIDEFTMQLAEKREEVYSAFESRRNTLVEARNNRTASMQNAANRILEGIQKRAATFKEANEINSFFASDLMVDKVRDIIRDLYELEDSNKADSIQTRLKTLKEEAVRQLRDRQELYVDGANIMKLGKHRFSVNTQALELTIVRDNGEMRFHLTGTEFYEPIKDPRFLATKEVWKQTVVSENEQVYRGEYLAFQVYHSEDRKLLLQEKENLLPLVQTFAATRYQEGYTKGIQDEDAAKILYQLVDLSTKLDLLYFTPRVRACAKLYWLYFAGKERKALLNNQLKSAGIILQVFPDTHEFDYLVKELKQEIGQFLAATQLFPEGLTEKVANYLFKEVARSADFVASQAAVSLVKAFQTFLKKKKATSIFDQSVKELEGQAKAQYNLIRRWLQAYIEQSEDNRLWTYLDEASMLIMAGDAADSKVVDSPTITSLEGFQGDHPTIQDGVYEFDFHQFMDKLEHFSTEAVPKFEAYAQLKKELTQEYRRKLQLSEFQPRVLSSFVRNQLIDKVYLPLFGDNFAKQLGTVGEDTRTDRMGLLLLISPPGYGKTTLMEYIANRLGLIFVKVNGPAIGHEVTSLAPEDAPSMAASKELNKLNLSLEMGDNIMLYLDDIQHCNPEFLQKFISLCDAQRKIEGVYNGVGRTYDLRGKRFCIVMAGNPYTESGAKFRIPDMLANRADIYNLGDIIGETDNAFKMSYIENALTSNPTMNRLAGKNLKDVYAFIKLAETGSREGIEFEGQYGAENMNEYQSVLQKLLQVRDIILSVNQEYIRSAAMSDEYRTEPAFKLQGSYRDMNKLAAKIEPILNEQELKTIILDHYESEAQTLTADAEANLLKLKEMLGWISEKETSRWEEIKKTFNKNKVFRGMDGQDPMSQVIAQMSAFTEGVEGIRDALKGDKE